MRFDNKSVVITGAGRGIGARAAKMFADEGARVAIADIDADRAAHIAASIPGAIAVTTDVSSKPAVAAMVDLVLERFGRIDVLINDALSCTDKPFLELTDADIRKDFEVTVMGAFFTCQEVIPSMTSSGGGVILNVSSVNGNTFAGNEAYSAAKAGLQNLTKSLAVQYGHAKIRCNAVVPGTVATEIWQTRLEVDPHILDDLARWYPAGRVGTPDDIAAALLFLASDAASWVTGAILPVDGGLLAGNLEFARNVVPSMREA